MILLRESSPPHQELQKYRNQLHPPLCTKWSLWAACFHWVSGTLQCEQLVIRLEQLHLPLHLPDRRELLTPPSNARHLPQTVTARCTLTL